MKLTTVAVFGVGYLLGTRAGRERYEQIVELTHGASGKFAASGARRRLEEYGARLEAYAAQSRTARRARASRVRAGRVAQRGREVVAGPGRDPEPPPVDWPERTRRTFRLRRSGPDPARGDMVIGAFVLARLLGIRLLTLEARVIVHEDDRGGTGPGPLVLTAGGPDHRAPYPARPGRRVRPVLADRKAPPDRPVPFRRPGLQAPDLSGWPAQCGWWSRGPTRSSEPGGPSIEVDCG